MGVPKKRMSKQKRDQRRGSNWKITAPNVGSCPNCQGPVLAHRACPACGHYKGKAVMKGSEE